MKKTLIGISLKILTLILIPLVVTTAATGIHKEAVIINEDSTYIEIKSAAATESIKKEEYILGVTAGLMSDWDFDTSGASEIAKMYGVLINTYMTLKAESSLVLNVDDFDLNYLNPEKRKILWGTEKYDEYERILTTWLSEVTGLVIKSGGSVITPYFHEISAGATRSGPAAYLINADTSHDLESASFLNVIDMDTEAFYELVTGKYPDCQLTKNDIEASLQIVSRDSAGYVTKILVGTKTISGEEFASVLALPSPSFTINYKENVIRFITKGVGHGYGISLNHAAYLAEKQYTYDSIIAYFYDNIEITNE